MTMTQLLSATNRVLLTNVLRYHVITPTIASNVSALVAAGAQNTLLAKTVTLGGT
jgi:hypothetical protein